MSNHADLLYEEASGCVVMCNRLLTIVDSDFDSVGGMKAKIVSRRSRQYVAVWVIVNLAHGALKRTQNDSIFFKVKYSVIYPKDIASLRVIVTETTVACTIAIDVQMKVYS